MCFSAEASFGAAAVIAVVGMVSIKKSSTQAQRVFAVIPLFFAIQQFLEGWIWIVLANPEYLPWKQFLTIGYLIFVWVVWPLYVPFSMVLLERKIARRKILYVFLGLGLVLTIICLYILIFHHIEAVEARLHIHYFIDNPPSFAWLYGILYLVPTVVSFFISSIKKFWIMGLVLLSSYIFSIIVYAGNVLSVWCFFGAVSSVLVLWYIIRMNKKTLQENIPSGAK